ncbi:MAG: MBL fold metallo-hydrolase RNA specificity domain-containing protein [Candidatus Hodarchaeales archaeon]
MLKILPFGAADEVGRSCFIVTDGETRVVLDSGVKIQPKSKGARSVGPTGIDEHASDIDAVILSHAHLDHSGYIPALFRSGFRGKVYMTQPTRDIVSLLWKDHIKIEGPYHYGLEHLLMAKDHIETVKYRQNVKLPNGISFKFFDAGHILGSASAYLEWNGTTILYTGDVNNQSTPFFDPAEVPNPDVNPVDFLLTETTNAGRKVPYRKNVLSNLTSAILKTYARDGKVLIPSFALGRSQEIEYYLLDKLEGFLNGEATLWVDGMIQDMNLIYEKYFTPDWVSKRAIDFCKDRGFDKPFDFPELKSIRAEPKYTNTEAFRRDLVENKDKSIILTTSGMIEGGPVHSYLRYAGKDTKNLLAIVGYQVEDTIGYEILNGKRKFRVTTPWETTFDLDLKLQIKRFRFSGHITQRGLESYLDLVKPRSKTVITIHGSPDAMRSYGEAIASQGYQAISFENKKEYIIA